MELNLEGKKYKGRKEKMKSGELKWKAIDSKIKGRIEETMRM